MSHREILNLLKQTRDLLSFHRELGIEDYPMMPALEKLLQNSEAAAPAALRRTAPETTLPPVAPAAASPAVSMPVHRAKISTEELRQEIAACRQCTLAAGRHSQMLGEGTDESGLLIIADMPPSCREQEAGAGKPGKSAVKTEEQAGPMPAQLFADQADELLTRMLAAIGLERESVYITPLLKCLPAHDPEAEELQKCLAVLRREIGILNPRIICTMGPLAARTLLGGSEPLFSLRGRFHRFQGLPLMPTFHPAYLLRNPEMKKAAWLDLQAIQKGLLRQENAG